MKYNIPDVNMTLTHEVIDNGLSVYIIPKENVNNIVAALVTKYGSNVNEFIPLGKDKMTKFPEGIAHFLEHKMFEQEDNIDPFEFFSQRGADCNASTSKEKTIYYFAGPSSFEENLNHLLDYVQSPYFTDENVEKEKGIIEQELKMYLDQPGWILHDSLNYNTFNIVPEKYPIGGTVEDIRKITKEQLYDCYNTFYHPTNMFLVIVGNVDVDKTLNLIKENQNKKSFEKQNEIKKKKYKEAKEVAKIYEEKYMDVSINKFTRNYKIHVGKLKEEQLDELIRCTNYMLSLKFGATSLFLERLRKEQILNSSIGYSTNYIDEYLIINFIGETELPKEVLDEIDKELNDLTVTKEQIERKKKMSKANFVSMSDSIFSISSSLIQKIMTEKKLNLETFKTIEKINLDNYKKWMEKLYFDKHSTFIIYKK